MYEFAGSRPHPTESGPLWSMPPSPQCSHPWPLGQQEEKPGVSLRWARPHHLSHQWRNASGGIFHAPQMPAGRLCRSVVCGPSGSRAAANWHCLFRFCSGLKRGHPPRASCSEPSSMPGKAVKRESGQLRVTTRLRWTDLPGLHRPARGRQSLRPEWAVQERLLPGPSSWQSCTVAALAGERQGPLGLSQSPLL